MEWKRGGGIFLIIVGLFITFMNVSITGNVIGVENKNYITFLGVLIFIIGLILLLTQNLEDKAITENSSFNLQGTFHENISGISNRQIIRIISGEYTADDYEKIDSIRRLLIDHDLYGDVNVLDNPQQKQAILLGYYAGSKRLDLRGFSEEAKKILKERFRIKPRPGRNIGGNYFKLMDLVENGKLTNNKIKLELKRDKLYRNGKLVQGMRIRGDYLEFTGSQFTSKNAAEHIIADERFEIKNHVDPYIYFSEPGWFSGKTETQIRHSLGASSADHIVRAKIRYPIDKIWIKAAKGRPMHIAVDGDIDHYNLLRNRGKLVDYRPIHDL